MCWDTALLSTSTCARGLERFRSRSGVFRRRRTWHTVLYAYVRRVLPVRSSGCLGSNRLLLEDRHSKSVLDRSASSKLLGLINYWRRAPPLAISPCTTTVDSRRRTLGRQLDGHFNEIKQFPKNNEKITSTLDTSSRTDSEMHTYLIAT